MKLSVSSYSYSSKTHGDDLAAVELAAKQGFEGIEFAEIHPADGADKLAWAELLREKCAEKGLEIVSYTIGGNFITGCGGDLNAEIERLKSEVDVAAALGVKLMRHDAAYGYDTPDRTYKGFRTALPRLIEGCSRVTNYAQTRGIETMTENHGTFCQESARVEELILGVGDPNFGALIDVGNFLCADEDPASAVGRLAPYVKHVHAKDFHKKSGNGFLPPDGFFATRGGNRLRGAVIGHGDVPVLQCMRVLAAAGYDGFVSVEFEGVEDAETGVAWGKNTLEKIFAHI